MFLRQGEAAQAQKKPNGNGENRSMIPVYFHRLSPLLEKNEPFTKFTRAPRALDSSGYSTDWF
jgi:hypothetical protein